MKTQTMRIAFLVLFTALTVLFIIITLPFMKAMFLAFTLTVIFYPLHRFLMEKRIPRYVAAFLSTLIVALCVILPFAVLSGIVVTQIGHFIQNISAQLEKGLFATTIQSLITIVHDSVNRVLGSAPSAYDLQQALFSAIRNIGEKFYYLSPRVLTTTLSIVANFLLMLLFLVVFFAEGGRLYDWLMETSPISPDHRKELARDVRLTITSSIVAAIVTSIAQGFLLGIGFKMAGFGEPYSWALIAMIVSLIPVIGASSCYITASILLFSWGNVKGGLLFLLYGITIVSSIDNIIRPIIVRSSSRMHPLLLFVTLIGSIKLFGPIGLLVGPVLLSIFLASLRIYRREFAQITSNSVVTTNTVVE